MLVRDCVLVKDFKRRQVVIKELTAKVWLCLLCKEKPKLLGHLTNNHFSKELAKDFGAVEENSVGLLPDEMKEEMMRKATSSMNIRAVEKKENKTKSAAISTKRKAENGEGQRSVKPKI